MTFSVEDQITNLMAEKLNIEGGFQDQQVQNLSKEMDRLMVYNYQSKNDNTQEKILNTPGPKLDNEFKDLLADKCKSCGKSFSESEPRVPGLSKKTNESRRFIKRNKYRKWKRRTKPMKSFLNSNYQNWEMKQQQLVVGNNLQNRTFYTGVNENNKDVSFINFNLAQGAINYENNENIGVINQFSTEQTI